LPTRRQGIPLSWLGGTARATLLDATEPFRVQAQPRQGSERCSLVGVINYPTWRRGAVLVAHHLTGLFQTPSSHSPSCFLVSKTLIFELDCITGPKLVFYSLNTRTLLKIDTAQALGLRTAESLSNVILSSSTGARLSAPTGP
jgi:hypothetical protein